MKFRTYALITTAATFALILLGGYVKATGAGSSCGADWPKCHGEWFPDGMTRLDWLEWTHRLVASVAGPMILAVGIWAWRTERANKPVFWAAVIASVLLPMQILMGGATVLAYGADDPSVQEVSVVIHLGFAALIFAGLAVATVLAYVLPTVAVEQEPARVSRKESLESPPVGRKRA